MKITYNLYCIFMHNVYFYQIMVYCMRIKKQQLHAAAMVTV